MSKQLKLPGIDSPVPLVLVKLPGDEIIYRGKHIAARIVHGQRGDYIGLYRLGYDHGTAIIDRYELDERELAIKWCEFIDQRGGAMGGDAKKEFKQLLEAERTAVQTQAQEKRSSAQTPAATPFIYSSPHIVAEWYIVTKQPLDRRIRIRRPGERVALKLCYRDMDQALRVCKAVDAHNGDFAAAQADDFKGDAAHAPQKALESKD
ncbi:MAG: hypothetical protein WCF84_02155 [Anaerolineae bacterium]